MNRRPLGATGLWVTPIGLGMAALGRPGYINLGHAEDLGGDRSVDTMKAHAYGVLDVALALGVRYYDAARSYGRGEAFLGAWLRSRFVDADEEVVVGSKWGYTYTADWRVDAAVHEVKEHTLAVLRRQWRESRENLGDFLRLYQIHSATLESGVLDDRDVLSELARLKAEGIVIGLTLSGPNQSQVLKRAAAIRIDGRRLFDCVQATWNVLEPSGGGALEEARNEGIGVIVKEALANGRLTSRNADPGFARTAAVLARQARRLRTSVDALALAAVLAQPWADVVLSGAATQQQIHSNARATQVRLDEGALSVLDGLAERPEDYWSLRGRLPWT